MARETRDRSLDRSTVSNDRCVNHASEPFSAATFESGADPQYGALQPAVRLRPGTQFLGSPNG